MGIMDVAKQMKSTARAYRKDPNGLYFNQLFNVLEMYKIGKGISKDDVLDYVIRWKDGKIKTDEEI